MTIKHNENLQILLICLLLYCLLVPSPLRINHNLRKFAPLRPLKQEQKINKNELRKRGNTGGFINKEDLILEQLKKSNTEIQNRIDQQYKWVEIKYSLIGGLIVSFIAKIFFNVKDSRNSGEINSEEDLFEKIRRAIVSQATSLVLSLSLIIAATVDTQMLRDRKLILQQGAWIANYVEPAFLNNLEVLSWEEFLRLSGGYHDTIIASIFFNSNIFAITITLYAIYIFVTSEISNILSEKNTLRTYSREILLGFWLMQGTLLFSTLSIHIAPPTFEIMPFPIVSGFFNIYCNPLWSIPIYFFLWLCLVWKSLELISIHKREKNDRIKLNKRFRSSFALFILATFFASLNTILTQIRTISLS